MRAWLSVVGQCRMILHAASFLVPRRLRADWLKEWEAEVAWRASSSDPGELRARCWGAFLDAAWHRYNREQLSEIVEDWARMPVTLLLLLAATLGLVVFASGGLPRMRSILLSPSYDDTALMATVSRKGVISSAEWVVPYSWIEIWRENRQAIHGVAAYTWKPMVTALAVDRRQAKVRSVRVEDSLFQVFQVKPLLGRIFPSEAQRSHPCVLLSYETWRREFSSDRAILRKKAKLDGQEAEIIGVLPQGLWFPSSEIGLWRLESKQSFVGKLVGVVVRLQHHDAERWTEWALERDVSNMTGESFSVSSLQVWSIQDRIRQPLMSYMLALFVTVLVVTAFLCSGRLKLRSQRASPANALRWWSFLIVKSVLLLSVLLGAVVELTSEPYVFPSSEATFIIESVSLWAFSIGSLFLLWWSLVDQQSRCRVCLRKLVLPASIGRSGCQLLSWVGTELACPEGHGLLHLTETDVSWVDPARWTELDESWESLFSEKAKSQVFG